MSSRPSCSILQERATFWEDSGRLARSGREPWERKPTQKEIGVFFLCAPKNEVRRWRCHLTGLFVPR